MYKIQVYLDENTSLDILQDNRLEYRDVTWLAPNNCSIKLWEVEDDYLLHLMKLVSAAITTRDLFPLVEELKSWNGVSYFHWAIFLYNEFLFREKALEKQYEDYSIKQDSSLDFSDYYYY